MNINSTLVGQVLAILILFAFAGVIAYLSYYLGKRKTDTPKLCAGIGFFTGLLPPLALIFLIILVLKDNKVKTK